jgi:4-hydroxy-tetrahydrodipicolinate synthase
MLRAMRVEWTGIFPALTTQLTADQELDTEATMQHVEHLLAAGVHGVVMLGTLGEGTSLSAEEKRVLLAATVSTVDGRVPVLAGVAEYTTVAACRLAHDAEEIGADGLMVLPGMVYRSDARETLTHFRAVARASGLPVMVYNNPVSYGVDVTPALFAELADEDTLVAIKESSEDTRRIVDLRNAVGDRYVLFCGVDDIALEALAAGADGWLAGLVNAFPAETARLWELIAEANLEEARALYRWFMPLLHLDTHVKLVQYIKLAVAAVGWGTETVRAPRLPLEGEERERVLEIIRQGIADRPAL